MTKPNNILLKALGLLLLVAAVLKGAQLLTQPVADSDIWSSRPFLVFQVEFELALAIWLLSGLFKKAAWLAALLCFSLFSFVTLYKAVTGAVSCGCFGSVHVNPWLTLLIIDIPAVIALLIFRPSLPVLRSQESIKALIRELLAPLPSLLRLALSASIGLLALAVTTPILALNKPAAVTSSYEILEPEAWPGKQLPILEHIDIADQLKTGNWLILLYHHDCHDCTEAIPKYERIAHDLAGNGDFLRIALIEVPPYGPPLATSDSPCMLGRLANTKEWFVTTPAVALLTHGTVNHAWEAKAPDFDTILSKIASAEEEGPFAKNIRYPQFSLSRKQHAEAPERR